MPPMDFLGKQPVRAGFWAVLLIGVLAWAPATYPGYWQGLNGFIPVFNVVQTGPIAGVATSADLWRGTGNAAFILAKPFLLFGATPTTAVRAVFILCIILGGLGIYTWLRPRYGDRTAGLAGVIYMFLPPVLATTYVRGDLGDAMMLALLPLALASAAAFAGGAGPGAAGLLVISVLWMWRTQAGLAVIMTLLLLAYALLAERHRLTGLVIAMAGAAGLTSLIPIWGRRAATPVTFTDHFVAFFQLFGNGWRTAPSIPGWQDEFPFQLGIIAVVFTLLTAWLILMRRYTGERATSPPRFFWFALASTAVLVMLSLTPTQPIWALTGADRLLTYPWQVMLPAMPFLALSAGMLSDTNPELRRMPLWMLLLAMTVLGSYAHLTADFTQVDAPSRPYAMIGHDNNLAILHAELAEGAENEPTALHLTWQALQPFSTDYNVFFHALHEDETGMTVLAQLDTPPLADGPPTSAWRQGEIMQQTYTLMLPPELPASGRVLYYFGFYDWRDGTRLAVDGGIDDKLVFYGR